MEMKITESAKGRRREFEWQTGTDQFAVLSVAHRPGLLYATLRRERREHSGGMESRIYAPFQDTVSVSRRALKRYSIAALRDFAGDALRIVVEARERGVGEIAEMFAQGTTA